MCHIGSGSQVSQNMAVLVFRLEPSFKYPLIEDEDSENLYVRDTTIYILPKNIRERLKEFDKKVVRSFQLRCPSSTENEIRGQKFIEGTLTKPEADEWAKELKVLESEYFQLRDEIVSKYFFLVTKFVSGFVEAFVEPSERAEAREAFMRAAHTKEAYRLSFEIRIAIRDLKEASLLH